MNFGNLLRAVDAAIAFRNAAVRVRRGGPAGPPAERDPVPPDAGRGLAGQVEARLTNVVVAALKEAFDRDHARLELERTQVEEQRRRAEAALRAELRRQAADRELARLRLIAGAALVGWIASLAIMAIGLTDSSRVARVGVAVGWLLLVSALACAFVAQGRAGAVPGDSQPEPQTGSIGTAALALLVAGLAVTALSVLL